MPSTGNTYTVQKGDTLWNIAKKFNTTVDEIRNLNNLTNNTLYVGQSLMVPEYFTAEDTNITYIVKSGDNLWSISRQYGVSVDDLKKVNNLISDTLSIGQTIKIPSSTAIIPPTEDEIINEETIYVVKPGDTLWSISKQYGVSTNDIKAANGLQNDVLSINQTLIIPVGIDTSDIIIYTVQKGDSLWSLARENNTTVDDIKTLNNITSDVLSIGQQLQIKKNTNI